MSRDSTVDRGVGGPADMLMWDPGQPGDVAPLRGFRCASCERAGFPSAAHCPVCGSATVAIPLGPHAQLAQATAVLHAPPGALVEVPYVVGIAQFDEGVSILGLVLVDDLDRIAPGDDVEVVVHAPSSELVTYAYRPV